MHLQLCGMLQLNYWMGLIDAWAPWQKYRTTLPHIDRGSTGSGGSTDPPLSRLWGQVMLFDPHFFMHKSMAGSLFTEARSVTLVVLCEKTHKRRRFRLAWLYAKAGDMTGIQFSRSIPFGLLTH